MTSVPSIASPKIFTVSSMSNNCYKCYEYNAITHSNRSQRLRALFLRLLPRPPCAAESKRRPASALALWERSFYASLLPWTNHQVTTSLASIIDVKLMFFPSYRHLQCEPAIIDAKDFSPQLRKRLFWGNIPGLYTVPNSNQIEGEMTLNMALIPNSGRQAALSKVRTLTTNTNSLLQGRTENCISRKDLMSLFPVHWDSKLQPQPRERHEESPSTSRKKKRRKKARHSPEKSDRSSVISLIQVDSVFINIPKL